MLFFVQAMKPRLCKKCLQKGRRMFIPRVLSRKSTSAQ